MGKSNIGSHVEHGKEVWEGDIIKGSKNQELLEKAVDEVSAFLKITIQTSLQRNRTAVFRAMSCPNKKTACTVVVEVNNYYQYLLKHENDPMNYEDWKASRVKKSPKRVMV